MKTEKEKFDAAVKAQKEKRAAIQAASDARKEKAMAPRRAKGLPASSKKGKTSLPAGEGSINKYMTAGVSPVSGGKSPFTSPKSTPKPSSGSGAGKRKVTRTASVAVSGPKREMPSGMSKPSTPGVSAKPSARQMSQREGKIAQLTSKIKSGEGSTAVNQAKIKALKAKEAMAKQKAMRKEKRAAVKAVKQSYK